MSGVPSKKQLNVFIAASVHWFHGGLMGQIPGVRSGRLKPHRSNSVARSRPWTERILLASDELLVDRYVEVKSVTTAVQR